MCEHCRQGIKKSLRKLFMCKEEPQATIEDDDLYQQAVTLVRDTKRASISYLQRKLKIGYNRAARIVEAMESEGVISPMDFTGARKVLNT